MKSIANTCVDTIGSNTNYILQYQQPCEDPIVAAWTNVSYNIKATYKTSIKLRNFRKCELSIILDCNENCYHTRYIDGRLDDSSFIHVCRFPNVNQMQHSSVDQLWQVFIHNLCLFHCWFYIQWHGFCVTASHFNKSPATTGLSIVSQSSSKSPEWPTKLAKLWLKPSVL